MDLAERSKEFLCHDEKLISSIGGDTWGLFATNWRLVLLKKTSDGKIRTIQDSDYKYISHIRCESKAGEEYRMIGAALTILGIIIILIGSNYPYSIAYYFLGGIFLISGIFYLLKKTDPVSILKIDLLGVEKTVSYELAVSASQMDVILYAMAKMRMLENPKI